ncbi:MAG: hypothetical protein RIQ79_201 [Verrucomicrobiota bacterium]|jgi:hypothetical protein
MQTYSDEPVLIKNSRRFSTKHWVAIILTLGLAGGIVYIPINNTIMAERAHEVKRGSHGGALYNITVGGKPHTIELTWKDARFAPILIPSPSPGTTLNLTSRHGTETLAWNNTHGCFGPASKPVDAFTHYQLTLELSAGGQTLWSDTLWAYGYQEAHSH